MNTERIYIVVLIFSFVSRLLYLLYFPLQYTDFYLINTAAENLIDGHGMGYMRTSHTDISSFYFEGLRLWPPMVTATVALFLKITGDPVIANSLAIGIILIFLFYYMDRLLTDLNLTIRTRLLVVLLLGINPDLIKHPGLSDLAAATFLIGACSACYRLLIKPDARTNKQLVLIGILLFLPTAFRYQFYPLSFFLPFLLIILSIYLKENNLRKNTWRLILTVTILSIAQELFLYIYTNQPLSESVSMDDNGFFLYNLRYIYPFFLKSFINISYLENLKMDLVKQYGVFYSAGIITAFIVWAGLLIKNIKQTKNNLVDKRVSSGIFLLLIAIVIPVLTLCLLSLMHNSRNGLPGGWTYVLEGRYYIAASLLTIILVALHLEHGIPKIKSAFKKVATIMVAFVLIYNMASTLKFYYNIYNKNIPDKEIQNRSDRKDIETVIDVLKNDTNKLVICSNEPYFAYYKYKKDVAISQKVTTIVKQEISTTKKVRLLIITGKPKTMDEKAFIKQTGAVLIKALNNCQLYITTIEPTRNTSK